jgi:predicted Zn-dependent protease
MKRSKCILAALLTMLMLGLLPGCVTNEAGRKQLMLVSPQEEMQMGLTAFNEMKKEVPISKDPQANALVQRVGKRIASVVDLPNAQWEFVVFESKEANAFCLPGGKIGVYTGILPITKDESGLATVLGHEVAHATLHHGGERMSREIVRQGIGQSVGVAASSLGADPRVVAASQTVYGTGTQLLEALPHSRAQESEADHRGLIYLARAGYDPKAAVQFWERFAEFNKQSGGSVGLWFLRTHPLDSKRIQQLEEWMPEAEKEYRSAASTSR